MYCCNSCSRWNILFIFQCTSKALNLSHVTYPATSKPLKISKKLSLIEIVLSLCVYLDVWLYVSRIIATWSWKILCCAIHSILSVVRGICLSGGSVVKLPAEKVRCISCNSLTLCIRMLLTALISFISFAKHLRSPPMDCRS